MPHPGAPQFQHNVAAHQGLYQGGDPYYNPSWPGPTSSPMGIRSPYLMHQGSPNFGAAPGRGHWFNNNPSPGPPGTCGGSPYPPYQGSPNFRSPPQGRGHWSSNSPRPTSPGPGRGGGPSPNVGRGRGWWDGSRMSPSPGYSGGRGRGRSYYYGQARSFYNKSMVEDPWASLTPVIWQGEKENDVKSFTNNRGYSQKTPTFHKPPTAKKPRVSNPFDASNSKKSGSLADYLAESFNEDVEEDQPLYYNAAFSITGECGSFDLTSDLLRKEGGHWSNISPSLPGLLAAGPGLGRGRVWWDGSRMSPSPGYSGGRERGRNCDCSRARSFYSKSMVEDPWEALTPVILQGQNGNDVKCFANNRGYLQKTPTFLKLQVQKLRLDASNSDS